MELRGAHRIRTGAPVLTSSGKDAASDDKYLTQLAKLFPVEVASIYPAGVALLQPGNDYRWWFAWVCALGIIAFRSVTTSKADGTGTQYVAIGVAVLSFLLWVVLLDGWFLPGDNIPTGAKEAATAITLVWTWIAPVIVAKLEPSTG